MYLFCFCLIFSLLYKSSNSAAILLSALDSGMQQSTPQRLGTELKLLRIKLNSADIALPDAYCNNTYGVCQNFCKQAEFCRIYCNPICCTSEEQRTKFCSDAYYQAYQHNSTKFRVTGQYYTHITGSGVGIWAEDELWLYGHRNGRFRAGIVPFALVVVRNTFYNGVVDAIFGLGRQSKTNSIVHILHRRSFINDVIVTIAYRGRYYRYYILGELNEEYCGRYRQTVNVVGDLHWMFDAKQAAFLNYKTEEHDFRILLETDSMTQMPRDILQSFLESGIASFDYTHKHYKRQNFLQLRPEHLNATFEFFFKLNKALVLYSDLKSIDISKFYFPAENTTIFLAAALDPNPDRVEWVVGRVVLIKYCAFLD